MTLPLHILLRRREYKRRVRAAYYAAGLDACGRPRKPGSVVTKAGAIGSHPADCVCFDCNYPDAPDDRPAIVECRVMRRRRT